MAISTIAGFITSTIGIGATGAGILAGSLEGAALGAATSAIEGKNPLTGALTGGLTFGVGAAAPVLGQAVGLSAGASTVIGDVVGGLGSAALEGKPLGQGGIAGLEAAAFQGLTGQLSKGATGGGAATAGGGVSSAAGAAAPAGGGISADPNAVSAGLAGTGASTSLNTIASGIGGGSGLPGDLGGGAGSIGSGGGGLGLPGNVGAGATSGAASDATGIGGGLGGSGGGGLASQASSTLGGVSAPTPSAAVAGPLNTTVNQAGLDSISTPSLASPSGAATGAGKLDPLKNPQLALAGVGLAGSLLKGNQSPIGFDQLQGIAKQDTSQGNLLQSYLTSGTLPPGLQSNIDTATNSALAATKSQYAARGMSGSSAEAQDIQAKKQAAANQGAQLAIQLYQQGVSESNIGAQIYAQIMQASAAQDAQASNDISSFAAALAGFGRSGVLATTGG